MTALGKAKLEEPRRLWQNAQHRFEAAFGPEPAKALCQSLASIWSAGFTKAFVDADNR